jgi:hypothetical protein
MWERTLSPVNASGRTLGKALTPLAVRRRLNVIRFSSFQIELIATCFLTVRGSGIIAFASGSLWHFEPDHFCCQS